MAEETLLTVTDLTGGYGSSRVLFGVSFSVPTKGGVAILGRNGAGKTTLLQTIMGELPATSGSITFQGRCLTDLRAESRNHLGIGYVPQEHSIFSGLTVRENLMVGSLSSGRRDTFDRALDIFPKLSERMSQVAGTLSGGERKMLAIGRALLSDPKLLVLDEPTEGVWIGVIEEISERLIELSKQIAIVIVEQHLELALSVANEVYVLDRGTIALHSASAEIRDDPRLLELLTP